jgi:hypothetical protein
MPPGWSKTNERQKHHVEASELAQGRSPKKARKIAFATVNKERTRQGTTKAARGKRN